MTIWHLTYNRKRYNKFYTLEHLDKIMLSPLLVKSDYIYYCLVGKPLRCYTPCAKRKRYISGSRVRGGWFVDCDL